MGRFSEIFCLSFVHAQIQALDDLLASGEELDQRGTNTKVGTWYNFRPQTFVECAQFGTRGSDGETDGRFDERLQWNEIRRWFLLGQIYE